MRRACLWMLVLLAACSTTQAPQPAQFDLGPAPSNAAPAGINVQLIDITAPGWLAGPGLAYRLDASRDPFRREVYRDSRWAAPPAALLAERVRQRAAASAARDGMKAVQLRIELEECVQLFDGPTQSHVLLRLRAWRQGDPVPRAFEASEPASSADAAGAVRATAKAADALIDQLLVWAMAAPR